MGVSPDLLTALLILAGIGFFGWLFYGLMRWARSNGRGTQMLGSVLTEVTQSAAVHEAKKERKSSSRAGDPPES